MSRISLPHRWLLGLVLAGYLLITLAYGLVNPLFEAPDEHWHYFTAQYIAEHRALPAVTADPDPWLSQEAAQPPLYYALGALLISPIDTTEAREQVWPNPFAYPGDASVLTNVNQFVHTEREAWPWQGYVLAAHLLRGFSTLLGLGTLLCVYGSGRLLWPQQPGRALLATALVAFLPQFNFLHAAVTNDALIIFLSSAALLQLIWLWSGWVNHTRLLLLGATVGLAALTKNAGILLAVFVVVPLGLRLIFFELQRTPGGMRLSYSVSPKTIAHLVSLMLPILLFAGWLWWRNWQLYGDPTAANQFFLFDQGSRDYTLWQVLGESGGLLLSLVAVFGWFNVLAPAWIFGVWAALAAVALAGYLVKHLRNLTVEGRSGNRAKSAEKKEEKSLRSLRFNQTALTWLLAGWVLLVYAGLVQFMMRTPAAQGRLLFPAILPLALALAGGISRWRWRPLHWLAPALALLTTVYALWFVLRPAYARPPTVTKLPTTAELIQLDLGRGVRLLGADVETETAVPGEIVWMTLYWQAQPVPETAPALVMELLGRDLARLGQYHSYHGRGQYPANLWPAGKIVADRVGIRLTKQMEAPVLARAFVRLLHPAGVEATGNQIATVKIEPEAWPPAPSTTLAQIGDGIRLTAVTIDKNNVRPGETVTIDVTWAVTAAPAAALTTLIHLAPPGQPPLATGDSPPLAGAYPTSVWAAGEVIADQYQLKVPADLPNGRYPLWLGMYDSQTITRLPLTVDGERPPNDVVQIGWLDVTN